MFLDLAEAVKRAPAIRARAARDVRGIVAVHDSLVRLLQVCLLVAACGVPSAAALKPARSTCSSTRSRSKGALYRPSEPPRDVAVLLIHRVNNYLGHRAAGELSKRGFLVLTMNSRFDNNEAAVIWEVIALDVKQGVEFLRRQPGIRRVVLFGHSGGAATLSFYQAVAEKGRRSAATRRS